MTPFEGAVAGAMTVLGCQCLALSVIIRTLTRSPLTTLLSCAQALRLVARSCGFDSLLTTAGAEPVVVTFEALERAIENGNLLSRPALIHDPPPEGPCDGHA